MISTGDLRKGVVIEIDKQLFQVLDYQHLKIGRGSAQVRMRLKNVRTGALIDRTVQAADPRCCDASTRQRLPPCLMYCRVRLGHVRIGYHAATRLKGIRKPSLCS